MRRHHVEIKIKQYADGRWGFDSYATGILKKVRLITKERAEHRALDVAVLLANGRTDLLEIDRSELARFRQYEAARKQSRTFGEVVTHFIEVKRQNKELHAGYVNGLGYSLAPFVDQLGERNLAEIEMPELLRILDSLGKNARSRNNVRDAVAAVFIFAKEQKDLSQNERSAGESLKRVAIRRSATISTYTPTEMRTILHQANLAYLPGFATGGFAGVRPQEIRAPRHSLKDPLRWEDFNWDDEYILIRPETSKTGIARHAPFLPVLKSWLTPWRFATGPIIPTGTGMAYELKRIETKFGIGRRRNAFRHSFGTYRMATIKSINQLAEEMGNTVYIARARYTRPVASRLAEEWWGMIREGDAKVVAFQA